MPHLAAWQWILGSLCAYLIGIAKTGAPGVGSLMVPLMVLTVGDARQAAGWTLPILSTADVFAVIYWRRHADAKKLFSMIPWTLAGMAGGALALSLSEPVIRRVIAAILLLMLGIQVRRRFGRAPETAGRAGFYGILAGFATTVANAAGPVMNLFLLTQKLPKEQFVATGAWFFFVVNLTKVPIYAWYHLFSRPSLTFNAMMVPLVVAGAITGSWLVRRVSQALFELSVLVLTGVCSLLLFF
ncbi:MAG: sulfite exporter TauE/SafE family protein [Bryobacterales bacterium]|nr:sulfite exporter TauE/SafE family protein [Bryobacterales bacterium]MBV9396472.1 sulfite exporter TauE/SafE family protein [Bryobacterales bacterium]